MRKLSVFNSVSLDGFFSGKNGDISWMHKKDPEWNAFVEKNATGGGTLLFGRITYDLMKSYWPTEQAMKSDPVVAQQMNNLPKIVVSRTLDKASWSNTKLIRENLPEEIRRLKNGSGDDITIMGSGSIVSQLAQEGLIDEYHLVLCPVVIGEGKTLFATIRNKLELKLTNSRTFKNGSTLLSYVPLA